MFGIVWLAMLAVLLFWFARQRSWGPRHELALVAAALGTYAWLGFVLTFLVDPGDPVRWSGNIVFAVVALTLVGTARRRIRTVTEQPRPEGSLRSCDRNDPRIRVAFDHFPARRWCADHRKVCVSWRSGVTVGETPEGG